MIDLRNKRHTTLEPGDTIMYSIESKFLTVTRGIRSLHFHHPVDNKRKIHFIKTKHDFIELVNLLANISGLRVELVREDGEYFSCHVK